MTWSYPIIRRGLIYVVEIRNGLYILRYRGRFANDIRHVRFLEGNSNLGDAVRLDRGWHARAVARRSAAVDAL